VSSFFQKFTPKKEIFLGGAFWGRISFFFIFTEKQAKKCRFWPFSSNF